MDWMGSCRRLEEILVHYTEENPLIPDLGRMGLRSTAVNALVQLAGIISPLPFSTTFFFFFFWLPLMNLKHSL